MNRRAFLVAFPVVTSACASLTKSPVVDAPAFTPAVGPIPHLGVNVGTYGPVPPWVLELLAARPRPISCRTAIKTSEQAQAALDAMLPYPTLSTLLLVERSDLMLVRSLAQFTNHPRLEGVECGNELDLAPQELTPTQFLDWTLMAYRELRTGGFDKPVVSGGIYSVDTSDGGSWHAEKYLSPLLANAPQDLVVGLHWYGDSSVTWQRAVKQLVSGRRVAVTEFGMPSRSATEDQAQRTYLLDKRQDFETLGVWGAWVYQWASGSSSSDLDNFGLQRTDATLKPGVEVLS